MINPDFTFVEDRRPVKDGFELLTRILYLGDGIANIVKGFEPSEKGKLKGKKAETYKHTTPEEYLRTYGYMAEHRRQWNLGNRIDWSEDIRVHAFINEEEK